VKPIEKLTGSDFFPDVIGVKEYFAFERGPGDLLLEGDQVRAAQRYGFWLQRLVRQVGIA